MKKKIFIIIFLMFTFFLPRLNALTCTYGQVVKFNANGGSDAPETLCVTTILPTDKPVRNGYKFLGWSTSKTATTPTYTVGDSVSFTEDTILYAVWAKGYKITYDPMGGTVSKTTKKVYPGFNYGELETPKKKGYTFLGWYDKSSLGTIVNSYDTVTKKKAHTIYAYWKKNKYTISYELNGGTQNNDNKTTYTVKTATFDLLKPTKKGYVFQGWYKESDFKNKVSEIKKGSTGNKTYYAKWRLVKYNIKFYGNGNTSGSTDKQSGLKYTKSYVLNSNGFKKKYYDFVEWNTKSDNSGKVYSNNETISNLTTKDGKTIKLYAIWKKKKYTITYELNGGVQNSDNKTTYTVKTATFDLLKPTKLGYKFKGWYKESNFKNKVTEIKKGSSGNKTFYAKWKENTYTISYVLNGGINPVSAPISYKISDNISLPTPTKVGYRFAGWFKDNTYTTKVSEVCIDTCENLTLYAKWDNLPTYTITYNLNGGTNPNDAISSYSEEDVVTLPTPTRVGYTFVGWYTESTFENKVTSIAKGSTGNKTFYANWTITNYAITYNLNSGTNPSGATTAYTINDDITLPTPARTGYAFSGWYTNSSFTGSAVTKIAKGSTGDKTLYAKWTIIKYYITYELDGGVNSSNAAFGYNVLSEITLSTPTKSGYQFLGWYENENFTGNEVTKIIKGSTGNKTFYAKWGQLTTYTITYNLNDGINQYNAPTTYASNEEVTLPTPTKDGYGFVGWYTSSSFTGSPITTIAKGTTGNIVLYAKWDTITDYTITYNLNGGANPSYAATSYTQFESVTLPTPTRSGYIFEGWYTSSTFSGSAVTTIEKGSTGNKTFYAKWTQNTLIRSYSYTFYNNTYDDKISSKNDIKNTLYNIMNEGKTSFTVYCNYSSVDNCFSDYSAVTQDPDIMKSISDYVNPLYNYKTMGATRYSNGQIDISITYSYTSSEKTTINNKIDQIISQNNMSSMTDANKIKAVHDYIVNNTVYNMAAAENPSNTSYDYAFKATGVLVNGSAVCQGYADTFALFMDRFKIPNLKVSSDTHTWNLVYINNKWLHVDATWDDPVSTNGTNYLLYDYYLKTTSELLNLDTTQHTFIQSNYQEG